MSAANSSGQMGIGTDRMEISFADTESDQKQRDNRNTTSVVGIRDTAFVTMTRSKAVDG